MNKSMRMGCCLQAKSFELQSDNLIYRGFVVRSISEKKGKRKGEEEKLDCNDTLTNKRVHFTTLKCRSTSTPIFNQMKHKVFFWLLLKDRLNTRDLLQRKGMDLESYTCDLCILQRRETVAHIFLRCNFAKACWNSIGIQYTSTRTLNQILSRIKRSLDVPFALEIVILMTSLRQCRPGKRSFARNSGLFF
jgi:hypothetical protein